MTLVALDVAVRELDEVWTLAEDHLTAPLPPCRSPSRLGTTRRIIQNAPNRMAAVQ